MSSMSSGLKLLLAASLASAPSLASAQASFASPQVCQGTRCVLPLAAPPAPIVSAPAPAPVEVIAVEPVRRGLGLLPLLLGAVALAGLIYLLTQSGNDDDDEEAPASP